MSKIVSMAEVLRRHEQRVAEQEAARLASEVLALAIEMARNEFSKPPA
jgi:hypothetical protein